MKIREFARALSVSVAAFLAGCTTSQPPATIPQGFANAALGHSSSWMLPDAKNHDLLYVYAYPQGTLEGQITDIMNPGGDCTDAKGNVYVT